MKALSLLTGALALIVSTTVSADPVDRVVQVGSDGPGIYYEIKCSNRTTGSVEVITSPPRVCATPAYDRTRCQERWSVQGAAEYACR